MLSIDFEQNFSVFHFDRSTYNGRSNTGVLPAILIKASERAYWEEHNNLVCTRNKAQARQFGSAYLLACEHLKILGLHIMPA